MSPALFFLITVAVTVLALFLQMVARRRRRCLLAQLASEWKMHFSPDDRFQLTDRVAEMLPVPGAARVRVTDLIYGNEGDGYRYLFCAWFTQGVLTTKRRCVRVATFRESRQRDCADLAAPMILAPDDLPLAEQYRQLRERIDATKEKPET